MRVRRGLETAMRREELVQVFEQLGLLWYICFVRAPWFAANVPKSRDVKNILYLISKTYEAQPSLSAEIDKSVSQCQRVNVSAREVFSGDH